MKSTDFDEIHRFQSLNPLNPKEIHIYLSDINRETKNVSITKDHLPRNVTPIFIFVNNMNNQLGNISILREYMKSDKLTGECN